MNILITGGASGLGGAITRKLAEDARHKVYFTYSKSKAAAEKIATDFSNTIPVKCDFGDANELSSLIENIASFDLDILINNAYNGDFIKTHFHKTPSEDFLNDFRDNIIPTIEITQKAINGFRKKRMGKIITILTSGLSENPPIGASVYIANKAYLEKLTKVWATENAAFHISSNSISPSFMQTNLTSKVDERVVEQLREKHPLKQLLSVEEVANTVAFFVDATPQINGVDITINAATSIK
jgi:NAD(P)-dependent dehydrogenase (short-subunit alcohol dehydrogenase family)